MGDPMSDAATIAAGLTKAQRWAVQWLASGNVAASDAFNGHSKEQPRRSTLSVLCRFGLAHCQVTNSDWTVGISADGLAVLATLKDTDHG